MITALVCLAVLQLPEFFDLRDVGGENYVTSVKSQQGGTCWTHGTMASMESNLLMTGAWESAGESGEPALAEYHLDWWNGFNNWYNQDMDPPMGSGGLTVHQGGDYLVATAYLSRSLGAVRDLDGQSFSQAPPAGDPSFHHYYPADVEWHTAGDDLASLDRIKQAVMEHGALATCYCASSSYMENFIQYQPPYSSDPPNHSVAIIGWDDNLITQAPEPGAWICKNSWGDGWGLDGFFYISYWDKWCGREPFMGAVSFTNVEFAEYERVYRHDYHGWRDTFTLPVRVMNAFEAAGDHYITAYSFFTADDSVECSADFFVSFDGSDLQGSLGGQESFHQFRGFHTVELDQPFQVSAGDSVYFVMEFSRGGYPYDRTADVPVLLGASYRVIVESAAAPGESYYYDGAWHDFYGCEENPYPETGNFCLKLLGLDRGIRISPAGDPVFQGEPGGPFTPETHTWTMDYVGGSPGEYQVIVQQADWLEVAGELQGTISPGQTLQFTASLTDDAGSLSPGVYTAKVEFQGSPGRNLENWVTLVVGETGMVYGWNMDGNPGWEASGDWEWGIPQGHGGAHGNTDPSSGFTGQCAYGYNHWGDYGPETGEQFLTTESIDCTGLTGVQLRFRRWLGVQGAGFDHAAVQVSTDQTQWHTVWENGSGETADADWSLRVADISGYADNQPQVWVRWVMGPTDGLWEYCGWNLDDVEIWALGSFSVDPGQIPGSLEVSVIGANPASTSSSLVCSVPVSGLLTVSVFDIAGREVRTVFHGNAPAGNLTIPFVLTDNTGNRLPAGVYPVLARMDGLTAVSRLVVLGR
jgi:C1A family cysteine protease